mmetsp:Transcript_47151/g.102616  ORF Transcript_47151/g.102616 Transcript_47151/m.102616 type:complete len:255 (-) Transcript_47151:48-812(-)
MMRRVSWCVLRGTSRCRRCHRRSRVPIVLLVAGRSLCGSCLGGCWRSGCRQLLHPPTALQRLAHLLGLPEDLEQHLRHMGHGLTHSSQGFGQIQVGSSQIASTLDRLQLLGESSELHLCSFKVGGNLLTQLPHGLCQLLIQCGVVVRPDLLRKAGHSSGDVLKNNTDLIDALGDKLHQLTDLLLYPQRIMQKLHVSGSGSVTLALTSSLGLVVQLLYTLLQCQQCFGGALPCLVVLQHLGVHVSSGGGHDCSMC